MCTHLARICEGGVVAVLVMALLSLDALLISRRVWQVGELALCGP